jgi:hypothetical protein
MRVYQMDKVEFTLLYQFAKIMAECEVTIIPHLDDMCHRRFQFTLPAPVIVSLLSTGMPHKRPA